MQQYQHGDERVRQVIALLATMAALHHSRCPARLPEAAPLSNRASVQCAALALKAAGALGTSALVLPRWITPRSNAHGAFVDDLPDYGIGDLAAV